MDGCKLLWFWYLYIFEIWVWTICMAQEMTSKCPGPSLIKHCECASNNGHVFAVNCTNTELNGDNLQLDIPETVKSFTFSGNHVSNFNMNFIKQCKDGGSTLSDLLYADLSRNDISRIDANFFGCVPNLETLLLNKNTLYFNRSTDLMFDHLDNLKELHLQEAFQRRSDKAHPNRDKGRSDSSVHITEIQWIFNNTVLPNLQTLHLEHNKLWYLNASALCHPFPKLENLHLSHNYITLKNMNITCLSQLKVLYVDSNSVKKLSDAFISQLNTSRLTSVNLTDNPWLCDCHFQNTLELLRSDDNKFVNSSLLWCYVGSRRKKFKDLKMSDLTCEAVVPLDKRLKNSYIVLGCVLAAIGIMFLLVLYLNRDKIIRFGKRCFDPFINYNPHAPRGTYSGVAV